MKRAFKIIIPILLSLSIILCLAWYLFIYDREFTRDMFLSSARYFEQQGKHSIATKLYNCAYSQAGDNDAVAIELAQQYKSTGNYTKAESTLSNAIADGGGIDLYIALCKTYIEQDKILDAAKLLDGVLDSEIRAQLDELRPTAPTATPEPGFYSQYISVTLASEGGTLYVKNAAEFPSIHDTPYTEPVPLEEGENTLYAITVSENGLVSPLSILGYTIAGVIEEVTFTDPAIETQIRTQLEVSDDTVLYTNDLWDILSFTVPADAASLADLSYLTFLEELTIANGPSGQFDVLHSLSSLKSLSITDTAIQSEELAVIGSLPELSTLVLRNCSLSTTTGLENAVKLTYLDLSNNTIRKIDSLSALNALEQLNLQHNALNNISKLSALSKLQTLNVSYNNLSTLSPITALTNLKQLSAENNALTNLAQLDKLANLSYLDVSHNNITDVSSLSTCKKLTQLDLSNNALTDISMLSSLSDLTEFNFSHNEVAELPAFQKDSKLIAIDGSHNLLTTLEPLSGLEMLNNVYMDYNPELDSVEPLADCPVLILVNVYGTKVVEVESLTKQSIVVNFDPTQVDE